MYDIGVEYEFLCELGSFQVCVWENGKVETQTLVPEEIYDCVQYIDGFAEFYPTGDHEGVSLVFREKASIGFYDIVDLDCLMESLPLPSNIACLTIHHAMHKYGVELARLDYSDIRAVDAMVSVGSTFHEAQSRAASKLYECCPERCPDIFHDLDAVVRERELIKFIHSPKFFVTQARFSNEVAIVVSFAFQD